MNCTNMEKKEVKNRMKKRILIFGYSSLIGGVETFIANLVKYLNKEEFEILQNYIYIPIFLLYCSKKNYRKV